MLKIGHEIVRPGKKIGDPDVNISIPEELEPPQVFPSITVRWTGTPRNTLWKA